MTSYKLTGDGTRYSGREPITIEVGEFWLSCGCRYMVEADWKHKPETNILFWCDFHEDSFIILHPDVVDRIQSHHARRVATEAVHQTKRLMRNVAEAAMLREWSKSTRPMPSTGMVHANTVLEAMNQAIEEE